MITQKNYGRKDPEAERRVKNVFDAVGIPALYARYEEKTYDEICDLIETLPPGAINKQVFYSFADKIYKRTK
jgi:farnesyl diphosphate synthase